MKCSNHPERDAVGTCASCGADLCTYCQATVEGKVYCPSCVESVFIKAEQRDNQAGNRPSREDLSAMGMLPADEIVPLERPNPIRSLPRMIVLLPLLIVVAGSIYAVIFLPTMWTAELGREFQEHKYVLEIGRGFAAGGDGHRIELFDNPDAKDPTWAELEAFLKNDSTDEYLYTSTYLCGDYAETVHNNAEKAGIRAGFVVVYIAGWDEMHGINAFETVDVGLVYIDCTGSEWPSSCSADKIVDVVVGSEYIPELIFPCSQNPDYTCDNLGTVTKVNIHW